MLLLLAFAMLAQRRVLSLIDLFARRAWRSRSSTAIVALRDRAAAPVLVGGADAGAQGDAAAVAPAPADPQARRQLGRSRG